MDVYYLAGSLFNLIQTQSALPGSGVGHSAGAGSPFSDFDAGVAAIVFVVAILVATLLFGAFLLVNLGLLSKRPEDWKLVSRQPSDLGILKSNVWPEEPYSENVLPAEETEEQLRASERNRKAA